MIILNETREITYCDLTTQTDMKVSLRDMLIFNNLIEVDAKKQHVSAHKLRHIEQYKKKTLYSRSIRPLFKDTYYPDQLIMVLVTHVVTPHNFYVIKLSQTEDYERMNEKLSAIYQTSDKKRFIQFPIVGMTCALKCPNWCRGQIIQILPNQMCEVLLVDVGTRCSTSYRNLMYLDDDFMMISQAAVKCQLFEVTTRQEDGYQWTAKAKDRFRRYCATEKLKIHIAEHDQKNDVYHVNMYFAGGSRDVSINSLMMDPESDLDQNHQSMIPSSVEAAPPIIQPPQNDQGFKRTTITVLNSFSPSEFYISFEKYTVGMMKLHRKLQMMMSETASALRAPDTDGRLWTVGESCIVHAKVLQHGVTQYYRATVRESTDADTLTTVVVLTDIGQVVTVQNSKIYDSTESLNEIVNGAIRCHLSSVSPTGGQLKWTTSAKEKFRSAIDAYEKLAITLHGSKKSGDKSFSVILWGLITTTSHPFLPSVPIWENINQNLVDLGLAHLLEKFDKVFDMNETDSAQLEKEFDFDEQYKDLLEQIDRIFNTETTDYPDDGPELLYDAKLTDDLTPIESWLPCVHPTKSLFVGIVTYVDNNAVFYIHDVEQNPLLDKMESIINERFHNSKPDTGTFWGRGTPCMARFHLDNLFHRAVVVDNIKATFIKVEFIDYGNIEECHPYDLRKDVILGGIPPICSKFCLTNIKPHGADTWSIKNLDFMHKVTVDKTCNIRVDVNSTIQLNTNDILPCSITYNGIDLSRLLVENNVAEFAKNIKFREAVDKCYDPYSNANTTKNRLIMQKKETGAKDRLRRNTQLLTYNELHDIFSDININKNDDDYNTSKHLDILEETCQIVFPPPSRTLDTTITDNNDEPTDKFATLQTSVENKSDDISFGRDNFETSTRFSENHPVENELRPPYEPFMIADDTHGFNAEVIKIISPLVMYISPLYEDHIERCNQMMNTIQSYALKARRVTSIEVGTPCIALDRSDEKPLWYRGIIQLYDLETELFTVLLVDTMKVEKFLKTDIRKCPMELRKYPLRNMKVKLVGVECNQRLRCNDILKQLDTVLNDRRVYVKVVQKKEATIYVQLYKDHSCGELAYDELINEKFFVQR